MAMMLVMLAGMPECTAFRATTRVRRSSSTRCWTPSRAATGEGARHRGGYLQIKNGRLYCAFPEIWDCAEPGRIPVKPVAIDDIKVISHGLGRSIYSPVQLEEFACFQESQGM
jgi:hypothetical protein